MSETGRRAVVSDVHSNLEALGAVLARLQPEDRLLCLGDIVGYGPNPNECVRLVRERAETAVMGNHDLAAIENFGLQYFNAPARVAIEWTQTVLSQESVDYLSDLAYEARTPAYLLVHGAPVRYFSYILDVAGARRAFESSDAPLIFVGHSHIAEYYALTGDRIEHGHMQHGGELELAAGVRYIVNVGSVGQPRDLNPKASFVWYDPEHNRITWERVDYDISAVAAKIEHEHLPAYLAERLQSGR